MSTAFCKRIVELRKERGFSQTRMAKALKCSRSFYSQVEAGIKNPFVLKKIKLFAKAIKQPNLERELVSLANFSQKKIVIPTINASADFIQFVQFIKQCAEEHNAPSLEFILKKIADNYFPEDNVYFD